MKKLVHPHVAIEGAGGPAGTLYGHVHECCPVAGLTFQCGYAEIGHEPCGEITTYTWAELDAYNEPLLERAPTELVCLPPCPKCGGQTMFGNNDIEYGSDLPEHHSMKAIREHVVGRPAFRNLQCWEASRRDPSHPGRDFSHLPKARRPDHHCKVDLAAECAHYASEHAEAAAAHRPRVS
jgi:hypothetical protein